MLTEITGKRYDCRRMGKALCKLGRYLGGAIAAPVVDEHELSTVRLFGENGLTPAKYCGDRIFVTIQRDDYAQSKTERTSVMSEIL